jgi:hypothetical protein
MGVFQINNMQQLKIGVMPLRQLAGELEDIAASIDKVRYKQKRSSSTAAHNRFVDNVDFHDPLLLKLDRDASDASPRHSAECELAHSAECKVVNLRAHRLPKSSFAILVVF